MMMCPPRPHRVRRDLNGIACMEALGFVEEGGALQLRLEWGRPDVVRLRRGCEACHITEARHASNMIGHT